MPHSGEGQRCSVSALLFVAAAKAWLALFLQDRLRHPLLVVRSASRTGKTECMKSRFKHALELKVGSLEVFPEGMRGFERDTHDATSSSTMSVTWHYLQTIRTNCRGSMTLGVRELLCGSS